jgi:diguanylate cyclase (GGDEF)-like protein
VGAPGAAQPATASHSGNSGQRVKVIVVRQPSTPASVISHFISVIPLAIWIALGAALGLAAMGGGAAVTLGRRARFRAGEVAAVTAAAATDQLTGILSRRGFMDSAERELGRARRYGHPLALAYVDVRGLKAVNDSEGHLAGDRLLREVALLLSQSARAHDLVGRIGGDELVVLLAEQSAAGAAAMTRRIRAKVPAHRAALGLSTGWDVTIGTASFPADGDTLDELIATADRRLYEQRGIELRTVGAASPRRARS